VHPDRTDGPATVLAYKRAEAPAPSPLAPLDPIAWHGQEVPPRRWLVRNWIPDHAVTGLYGDGGVGKSLLSLQLLTACATGKRWLGRETKPCKAIGFFCEDTPDELHRRQAAVNVLHRAEMCDLEYLRLFSRVADENALMTFGADGIGHATDLFAALLRETKDFGAQVLVIDTAGDTFCGNENVRNHVRQFISCLTRLARAIDGAVVLCAHPSVDPLKDTQAEELAIKVGLKSRSEVIAERGRDPEVVDAEIAEGMARAARLGIKLNGGDTNGTPPTPGDA
jgi:RecA-family ATPase